MAHTLELTVSLKVDGVSYPGFPLIRRLQVDQIVPLGYVQAAGAGYTSLAAPLTALQMAVLSSDQALSARCNNQSTGSIPLNANGVILFFDVNIDTATLLSVLNSGSVNANMNGLSGGSK